MKKKPEKKFSQRYKAELEKLITSLKKIIDGAKNPENIEDEKQMLSEYLCIYERTYLKDLNKDETI